jgi:hypothetical protein
MLRDIFFLLLEFVQTTLDVGRALQHARWTICCPSFHATNERFPLQTTSFRSGINRRIKKAAPSAAYVKTLPIVGYVFRDVFVYQYYTTDSVASNTLPTIFFQLDPASAVEVYTFGFQPRTLLVVAGRGSQTDLAA